MEGRGEAAAIVQCRDRSSDRIRPVGSIWSLQPNTRMGWGNRTQETCAILGSSRVASELYGV